MPQLSLYIDNTTLSKIEKAAKIDHKSISKWVTNKLKSILNNSWPDNFDALFGSIKDNELPVIKKLSFKADSKRIKL
ncbi:MAG: toxin-antitoxin system, antitoxin component [Spirochaetes bacterium GWF1_41_5]|nr:MAG: toxin-antitoxin system, antitoxin component [Spirochaetes bacterium GWF1_41_5]